jgi:methionyl-tRNA synthetase
VLLQPYIPETAEKIASFIKVSDLSFESLDAFGKLESTDLEKATVLFERYDMDKKIEEITKDINE